MQIYQKNKTRYWTVMLMECFICRRLCFFQAAFVKWSNWKYAIFFYLKRLQSQKCLPLWYDEAVPSSLCYLSSQMRALLRSMNESTLGLAIQCLGQDRFRTLCMINAPHASRHHPSDSVTSTEYFESHLVIIHQT